MKKIFVFICLAFIAFNANAQKQWVYSVSESDELLGKSEYNIYMYVDGENGIGINDDIEKNTMIAFVTKGIFDYDGGGIVGIIGYYDNNDTLIKKENLYLVKNGSYSNGITINKKTVDFLKNENGYVRFVVDRYNDSKFDIKVPTFSKNKPIKEK